MGKLYSLFVFVLVISLSARTFAGNRADEPGPQVDSKQVYTTEYRNLQTQSVDKVQQQQNSQKPQQQNGQTDEFGYFNNNANLVLGATGYAAIPGVFEENFDGSLEAWVFQTATTSSVPAIVSKGNNSNTGVFFGINNGSGSVPFLRFGNTPLTNTGGIAIPLNTWTHIAVTWSGSPGAHVVNFYVNGAQSGPANIAFAGTWNIIAADSMMIGKSEVFGSSQFLGTVDEVRYWSNTRTLAQIRDNRFVGLGDLPNSNSGSALTSSSHYAGLNDEWTFNTGSSSADPFGNHTAFYRSTAGAFYASPNGTPIPYNFALSCPFGANDYVTVPTNAAFNLSTSGTAEAWVYPTGQTTTHMIMSRGTTGFDFFWGVRASITNKMAVDIGAGTQFQNSDGVTIPLNTWTHVAITWAQSGGNYTVTFYVNGQQSGTPVTNATTWTSTSGTLRLGGWHGGTANNWNGMIDEARLWNGAKNVFQIRSLMFASSRGLSTDVTGLVGAWNFDGSLLNFAATAGIDGSFSTGGANNCRFSAYSNESNTGPQTGDFIGYETVVNRVSSPQSFPGGFAVRAPNRTIVDVATTRDTIILGGSGTVTSVELFLSISHTFCSDLDIVLRAPNGQTRDITSDNGSGSDNGYLTFFVDGGPAVTNTAFLPPYSNTAGPEVAMGNMGGSTTNGMWILEVTDDLGGDSGLLRGWGIRLNGATTGIQPITSNIPNKFSLSQNYPNPFNPVTSIKFDIAQNVNAKLVVYDILGREVKTLLNEFTKAGQYEVKFDASSIASGTYFYRLEAGNFTEVKKLVVVK